MELTTTDFDKELDLLKEYIAYYVDHQITRENKKIDDRIDKSRHRFGNYPLGRMMLFSTVEPSAYDGNHFHRWWLEDQHGWGWPVGPLQFELWKYDRMRSPLHRMFYSALKDYTDQYGYENKKPFHYWDAGENISNDPGVVTVTLTPDDYRDPLKNPVTTAVQPDDKYVKLPPDFIDQRTIFIKSGGYHIEFVKSLYDDKYMMQVPPKRLIFKKKPDGKKKN